MNNLKKICKECGKDITNRDPRSKFCSRQCKGKFNYQLTKEIKKLNEIKTSGKKRCEFCGEVLENERKNKRFCNENCYAKARYRRIMENQNIKPIESARICKECGNVFISNRKGKIFCTESCSRRYHKRIYKRNKKEKEKVQLIRNCLFCGKEFVTGKKVKKYCSNKCSYSYHNEQKRINQLRQKNIEEIKLDIKQLSINEIKSIKTKKICKHCGVSFTTANERKIYCSEKCGSTFRNQRRARRLLEDKKQVATKTIQSSVKVEESVCKLDTLPKVGVYFGKFIPPHRGHLNAIIHAATRCQKLYVVVSDNKERTKRICRESGIKNIPVNLRIQWLSQELQDLEHIKVVKLDESNIPEYPNGWEKWGKLMKEAVGEHIDIMFCGEKEYVDGLKKHIHKDVKVELFDPERTTYNISATEIRENPYKHWDYILGPARPFFAKRVLIAGTESCVDCDTEFFNGEKWKKISDYIDGESVLQFNSDYSAELVKPLRFVKEKSDKLFKIQNTYKTWSQVYSEDHDMVYVTSKGNIAKKPFYKVKEQHENNKFGFQGKILNWFNYEGNYNIDENILRLFIAVSADGSKSKNKWRIRLIKNRKIERMRTLISNCGLELDERIYEDGSHNFYIPKEYGIKEFPRSFMHLTKRLKEVFLDEIFNWDGQLKTKSYFTTIKTNAEIAQFIFSSIGKKTIIYTDSREDRPTCYTVKVSNVKYSTMDFNDITRNKKDEIITEYTPIDGYKYCFTVPSGMLVLRRDNQIFITGNCGKSTLVKYLAKIYHTSWSEEVGRYYAKRYLGGNETIFTDEDFGRIANQQVEQDFNALRSANRVCFFDTDAVVTQYYSLLYMGHRNDMVEACVDPNKYDLVLLLKPDVEWVSDGQRLNGEQEKREQLYERLKHMYIERGFQDKIIEIEGNYYERTVSAISAVNNLYK